MDRGSESRGLGSSRGARRPSRHRDHSQTQRRTNSAANRRASAWLAEVGIDFIKDDELIASPPYSPLERRVEEVMRVVNEVAERTGRKLMYAFNITDDLEACSVTTTLYCAPAVPRDGGHQQRGARGVFVPEGVASCRSTRTATAGARSPLPLFRYGFRAYQKIWRLAGADQLHVNGIQNKF